MAIVGGTERSTRTALVVEDVDEVARLLQCVLQREGYTVCRASRGRAVQTYIEQAPAPDLITLDWTLPDLSGVALLTMMRATSDWKDVPVLLVTGLAADQHEIASALESGAVGYVAKPFSVEELRACIRILSQKSTNVHRAQSRSRSALAALPGSCA